MNTGVTATVIGFLVFAGTPQAATLLTDSGATVEAITSLDQVGQIVLDTQWQFWRIVPPSTDDPFYLHPERVVRVVDWGSKEWPRRFLKQMYAGMEVAGTSMYPLYRLTVVEERSGDLVYYNSCDQEVWRVSAPMDYNPYLFAFLQYGVEARDELTSQQQIYGRSSNVGVEVVLIPATFAGLYAEDVSVDGEALPLASTALAAETLATEEPVMMTSSSPSTPGEGGANTNSVVGGTSSLATLTFPVPVDFGSPTGEIFQCTNLVDVVAWDVGVTGITVTAGTNLVWTDMASSNIPLRYYILNDPSKDYDFDGLSDGREYYVYLYDYTNPDTDGDGLDDGWEHYYGFSPLSVPGFGEGGGDADGDGLSNRFEYVSGSSPLTGWSVGEAAVFNVIFHQPDSI